MSTNKDTPTNNNGANNNRSSKSSASATSLRDQCLGPVPVSITLYNLLPPTTCNTAKRKQNKDEKLDDQRQQQQQQRWVYRPEYKSSLLVPVRLDIIISILENINDRDAYNAAISNTEKIWNNKAAGATSRRKRIRRRTIHPKWNLLDEQIAIFDKDNFSNSKNDTEDKSVEERTKIEEHNRNLYMSMQAQIVHIKKEADNDPSSEHSDTTDYHGNNKNTIITNVSLHPTKVRRLPDNLLLIDGDSDADDDNNATINSINGLPVKALPPNAVIIRYSDGSKRVPNDLYDVLIKNDIIRENSHHTSKIRDEVEEANIGKPRFNNDLFDSLLGSAEDTMAAAHHSSPERQRRERTTSPSSLLIIDDNNNNNNNKHFFHQDKTQATILPELIPDENGNGNTATKITNGCDGHHDDDDNVMNKRKENGGRSSSRSTSLLESEEGDTGNGDKKYHDDKERRQPQQLPTTTITEIDADINDLEREANELELLIQQEQAGLNKDIQTLRDNEQSIRILIKEVSQLEQHTKEMYEATKEIENDQQLIQNKFVLTKIQRVKLLRELRSIYPIQSIYDNSNNNKNTTQNNNNTNRNATRYCIRGLEIPYDLFDSNVGEDEISAGLGYLCHLIIMMAKYLDIPLRYRLVFNSSRSAVQDNGDDFLSEYSSFDSNHNISLTNTDGTTTTSTSTSTTSTSSSSSSTTQILPLFQARMVSRDELDRGMVLLQRNIQCLVSSVTGINSTRRRPISTTTTTTHVLAQVKSIFDKIIDG